MKEHPILFSTPMVKAILKGTKTQTRRAIKPRNESGLFQVGKAKDTGEVVSIWAVNDDEQWEFDISCPYGNVGDILWVREAWRYVGGFAKKPDHRVMSPEDFVYRADEEWNGPFKPSIHMPKSAARIFLKITDIRIERLQQISEGDAHAEGIEMNNEPYAGWYWMEDVYSTDDPVIAYQRLWEKINGEESWKKNDFVWVVEFEKIDRRKMNREQEDKRRASQWNINQGTKSRKQNE